MRSENRFLSVVPKVVLALAVIAMHGSLQAQSRFSMGGAGKSGDEGNVVRPSGLQPAFPAQARCPEVVSAYGSRTRYDGSFRPPSEFGGHHGGIDITLAEGTPLLALAAGTVASTGEGGRMEGVYLWLRHSPEDTGLAYWVYSKYQHLKSLPDLQVGAKVAMGQTVAHSGGTGTEGGHYGVRGYPHLHLTTLRDSSGDATVGGRGQARGASLFDPLSIYHEAGAKPRESAEPPLQAGAVPIPYTSTDGKVVPPGTRVVWPVACQPK
ncbi:MAG: M23 family metallopeptidase [Burkholderiales bacterium]